jgi:LL-diaminopimelate aminotransferase
VRHARRLDALPEYLAAQLARRVAEARARGVDVISLGIGDPDLDPPEELAEALYENARRADTHNYPTNRGLPELREAVARYYATRFGVEVDPEREVVPLLGAKEGLAHLCLAQLDPGDAALIADPGYPVYAGGPTLAGAEPVRLPLRAEHGFLPDLDGIDPRDADRANLLLCGYPNNPTGAVAEPEFFERLAAFGLERGVPICHDNAYAEITYDGFRATSFLAAPGAKDAGIEVLSLSKALNMPGWRVAFAVGNAEMVATLTKLKTHIDSGMFEAVQRTAIRAFELVPAFSRRMSEIYARRRDLAVEALAAHGVQVEKPRGSLYLWMPIPPGTTSVEYAERLLAESGVVVGPGTAYGPSGEGYVRLSLTVPDERLVEAMERLAPHLSTTAAA